jgi:hypothetical protein
MKELIQKILRMFQEVTEELESVADEMTTDTAIDSIPQVQPSEPRTIYTVGLRSAYPKQRLYKGTDWERDWIEKGLIYDDFQTANKAKSNALYYLEAFAEARRIAHKAEPGFEPTYLEHARPVYVPFFRFNGNEVEIIVKERTSTFAPFAFVFPTESSAREFGQAIIDQFGY